MKRLLLLLVVGLLSLTGCASLELQRDEAGIRYSGGALLPESIDFKECQDPGTQEYGAPGDNIYSYPTGSRNFKFHTDPGSDAGPLGVSTPAPVGPNGEQGSPLTLNALGTATFVPAWVNPDGTVNCPILKNFHEQLGLKYKAWTPEGWKAVVGVYVKDPIDYAVDVAARQTDWVKLSTDGGVKEKWATDAKEAIPDAVKAQTGAETSFFRITGLLLQTPTLPGDLQQKIIDAEGAKATAVGDTNAARQRAETAKVNIETEAVVAQRRAEIINAFPGGIDGYRKAAEADAIRSGNIKVLPGTPVIVGGN